MSSQETTPESLPRFNRRFLESDSCVSFIGTGSLGGKAQGLCNINELLRTAFDSKTFPQITVAVPTFTVIRTDIFDAFMERNNLHEIALSTALDDRIAHAFQQASLPFEILGDLRALVAEVHRPLAVRSSSLLEDAMYEPFAGIYGTKMTPNNQPDTDTRFRKLVEAIIFVYASTYFKAARDYMKATRHKIESEKMAVIIQEVAGQRHENRFYSELSGVGRSFNFYPMGRALPEQGVVNLALGKTIVDGGGSWSYSPALPRVKPPYGTLDQMLKQTQTEFWAVNMGKPPAWDPIGETEYLVECNITVAESDGTIKHLASTLDRNSDRLTIGIGNNGPRILTFAPLLQIETIPLNDLLKQLLALSESRLKAPVEIEFAMTFDEAPPTGTPHRFSFLQVRPMVVSTEEIEITPEELSAVENLAASESTLGNGRYDTIRDIVYVKPDMFKPEHSPQVSRELEEMNKQLLAEEREYLLIGFGRWGSSDPWLGIPVDWGQISGARTIIEATQENINVELSQGSHFFHNLTSFNVCYFSLPLTGRYQVDWEWLDRQAA
ncbi:MAG: hypothetical protein ISR91_05715 [Candidatus Delongbacteria bacterium]|nr:hypothetical protein [Candidatus Delongbacteria bacterium]